MNATQKLYSISENDIINDIKERLKLGERSLIKLSEAARYMGLKPDDARLELLNVPKVNIGTYGRYHIRAFAKYLKSKIY